MIVVAEYVGLFVGVALNVDEVSRKFVSNVQRYSPGASGLANDVAPEKWTRSAIQRDYTSFINLPVEVNVTSLAQVLSVDVRVVNVGNERK